MPGVGVGVGVGVMLMLNYHPSDDRHGWCEEVHLEYSLTFDVDSFRYCKADLEMKVHQCISKENGEN